jgi:hypothetical protein
MGRVDEVRMCRAQLSGELVESVVPHMGTWRDIQHTVFSIEVGNGGAAAGRVAFPEHFLQIAVQKLDNSLGHRASSTILPGLRSSLFDSDRADHRRTRRGIKRAGVVSLSFSMFRPSGAAANDRPDVLAA